MSKRALLGVLLLFVATSCSTCAHASNPSSPGLCEPVISKRCYRLLNSSRIPVTLQPPPGNVPHTAYVGVGLMHYAFNGTAWAMVNVSAHLYIHGQRTHKINSSAENLVVGRHFFIAHPDALGGQPSWETTSPCESSIVTAKATQQVTVDPSTITWALFQATTESGSRNLLGGVTYVQRLYAKRGLPPSSTKGAKIGDVYDSPYSILYVYYVAAS